MIRRSGLPARAGLLAAAVAVAVTAPLALAPPAHAVSEATWDRVAQCESGGNWAANTGNGHYGGLQFSDPTWDGYGGEAYASTANHATRRQQITIAEKVLAGQGWGAWPTCSRKVGLR